VGAVGPYHYKVWVIGEVMDRYEEYKNGRRKPSSAFFVKVPKKKEPRRNAYFEPMVIYVVDLESLIEEMGHPLGEIIRGRYFEMDPRTLMKELGIDSRKEARRLIVRAVNKFFHELERRGMIRNPKR